MWGKSTTIFSFCKKIIQDTDFLRCMIHEVFFFALSRKNIKTIKAPASKADIN
jgi:hypothetical protein